jgi:hypothetical protein
METTPFSQLRLISDALNRPFTLRQGESLIDFSITDNRVTVHLQVHLTTETTREVRFLKRGIRLTEWKRHSPMHVWQSDSLTVWDDDFTPFIEARFGRGETHAEYTDRRAWEGMQYRVGSRQNPMDSASRASEGYSPMEDYWTKKG